MKNLITVLFEPTGRKINVRPGISLLEAAHKAGVTIRSECGGKGACGKCRVMVPDKNAVTGITEDENKHLSIDQREWPKITEDDLACAKPLWGAFSINVPAPSLNKRSKVVRDVRNEQRPPL